MTSRRAFLCAVAPLGLIGRRAQQATPNAVLLILDTVRQDRFARLSAAGSLPHLAALAARGARFDNAWAHSSWSLPSHATLLTGLHPHEHGADWPTLRLGPEVVTLPTFLASRGYVCGAFSGNSNWVTPEYLGRGFARFQAYNFESHLRRSTLGRGANRVAEKAGSSAAGRGVRADTVNERFFRFVDRYRQHRPFFAYLTYMDVNQDFHRRRLGRPFWIAEPPPADVSAAFDAGLVALDARVGELLEGLESRGLLRDLVMVTTSDHGESFGSTVPGDHEPEGHGSSLYPEQTKVPLFVTGPGVPPRVTVDLAGNKGAPATIAALAGLSGHPFGASLLEQPHTEVLATLNYADYRQRSLIAGQWLYLRDMANEETHQLFDLVQDPEAQRDLSRAQIQRTAMMAARVDQLLPSAAPARRSR